MLFNVEYTYPMQYISHEIPMCLTILLVMLDELKSTHIKPLKPHDTGSKSSLGAGQRDQLPVIRTGISRSVMEFSIEKTLNELAANLLLW